MYKLYIYCTMYIAVQNNLSRGIFPCTAFHYNFTWTAFLHSIRWTAFHAQLSLHSFPCKSFTLKISIHSFPCTAFLAQLSTHSFPCTAFYAQLSMYSFRCTTFSMFRLPNTTFLYSFPRTAFDSITAMAVTRLLKLEFSCCWPYKAHDLRPLYYNLEVYQNIVSNPWMIRPFSWPKHACS